MTHYMERMFMKIKKGYILKNVADQHIVVPIGEETLNFNGLLNLNESGVMLFNKLLEESTMEELIQLLTDYYLIDEETARLDIEAFINVLESKKIIER